MSPPRSRHSTTSPKVIAVVGARPNIVKIAPLYRALKAKRIAAEILHTGQHYDDSMSGLFFRQLRLPIPRINLGVGSGSHATQTARIMERLEPVLQQQRPRVVLVVGDVNSTLACALTAAKMGISVAHVEAGLRSFDRSMPEEINRCATDLLSELLFVTEPAGVHNLKKEGVPAQRIHLVGDVLADALRLYWGSIEHSTILGRLFGQESLREGPRYCVLTLHRPANVDDPRTLRRILRANVAIAKLVPVVFPVHPRTRSRLEGLGLGARARRSRILFIEPLGYLDFIRLLSSASLLLTDSGGAQQEAFILGVPCLTLRTTTERPLTLTGGMNRLVGSEPEMIITEAEAILNRSRAPRRISYWYNDGHAAERIAGILHSYIQS